MTTKICLTFLAYFAAGTLVLTGCSQPMAQSEAVSQSSAETESTAYTPAPIPKFDVPEYTTDLDLTAEEILAAEEALIGLQRYIFVSEQVMKSGGEDTLHIDSVSVDSAKEGLEETASDLRKYNRVLFGGLEPVDYQIYDVILTEDNEIQTEINACLPERTWGIRVIGQKVCTVGASCPVFRRALGGYTCFVSMYHAWC